MGLPDCRARDCARRIAVRIAVAASLLCAVTPVLAQTNAISTGGTLLYTTQFLGTAGGTDSSAAGSYSSNALTLTPGLNTFSFSDSLPPQTYLLAGSSASTALPGTSYTFQDSYKFSLAGVASGGDVLTVAFNAGSLITTSNLAFRLYEVSSAGATATEGALPVGATPVVQWDGTVVGGAITASFSALSSGTYFLDVVGDSSGTFGGGYGGTLKLNAPAVPLPGTLGLLAGGLGLVGLVSRRRRTS